MNPNDVHNTIIEILEEIQTVSGYEYDSISAHTKPLENLQGFDSLICPVVIAILEDRLKINIPVEVNIFYQERALSIAEAVALVMQITNGHSENERIEKNE